MTDEERTDVTHDRDPHLGDERIQAFLDGGLAREERARVEAHLEACPSCQDRLEGWTTLFAQLEELPRIEPPTGFPEHVLERLPRRESVWRRLAARLGIRTEGRTREAHPPTERILEYLDGVLPAPADDRLEGHLGGCTRCRSELDTWRELFVGLAELPRPEPAPGFPDRVFARIRAIEERRAATREDQVAAHPEGVLGAWLDRLRPTSVPGWAAAATALLAPAAALVGGSLALFSHPRLTPAYLVTFLWWRASGAISSLAAAVWERLVTSPTLQTVFTVGEEPSTSIATLSLGALLFSIATMGSVWILYRNLSPRPENDTHATSLLH